MNKINDYCSLCARDGGMFYGRTGYEVCCKGNEMNWNEGTYIVTGAASGLGKAIVKALLQDGRKVLGIDNFDGHIHLDIAVDPDKLTWYKADVTLSFENIPCPTDAVALINCAGINGADWFQDLKLGNFDRLMNVNARSIVSMSQWALPALRANKGTILNIVSNAAHIPMTASLSYNASKAAALMITKQMARELTKKDGITVLSLSPNKLKGTGMSKAIEENVQRVRGWTPEYAEQYQLNALLTGQETDPETCAEFIAFLLSEKKRHFYLSGCDIPYGA